MPRNYQREDWRRQQQPAWQEDDQWSGPRSDDDFSMGLGQESRSARGADYGRRGGMEAGDRWERRENMRRPQGQALSFGEDNYRGGEHSGGGSFRGREQDYGQNYGEEYRGSDSGWTGSEGWQSTSPWQRSQRRGPEMGRYENMSGRPGYEGSQDTMRRNEGQYVGRGPRGYKRSDDRIEEDINERLTQHGTIDATDIEVSVQNAEVTLRGTVDSRQAKRLAEDIADAVSGVKEVVNQIKIKQQGQAGESKQEETTGKQRKAS
jgi:osmotically-inducible protein OsmY